MYIEAVLIGIILFVALVSNGSISINKFINDNVAMQNIYDVEYKFVDKSLLGELSALNDVKLMGVWPSTKSMKVIDNILLKEVTMQ